ncbi:MAG: hypothetical protein IJ710_08955 [Prevotella sp.]|nr:hypothetical protein [Prevotella sp.]
MKKSILLFAVALGILTSCDPIKEEKDFSLYTVEASQIDGAVKITQLDADGNPATDGNYFTYTTSPDLNVTIYNKLSDGSENILARGMSGSFVIKPKRGSDPQQTFWIRVVGSDNQPVDVEKTYTVFVQQDLDPEIRLLASDAYGSKTWKWDASVSGAVWGNMGYCGGAGSEVGISGAGQWWGVTSEEEFAGQLQHAADGALHGDESMDATMVISDEGIITCYDKDGNVIRNGSFTVEGFDDSDPSAWRVGVLKTSPGAILWPYQINWADNGFDPYPTEFEIVYLTADKMTLVYPDGGAFDGLGSWSEATFWHFKSDSDVEGMAVGYGKTAEKSWTWDDSVSGAVWGNMGYCGGAGSDVGISGNGQWWGVTSEEEFAGQLQHSVDGALHGDESFDAYFTLSGEGTIVRHAGDGSVINSGTFEFARVDGNPWKVADLTTTAGTILWPYQINWADNGFDAQPTLFEVVYLTGDKMTLVYPDGGAFDGLGNWGEATFWHFKAK